MKGFVLFAIVATSIFATVQSDDESDALATEYGFSVSQLANGGVQSSFDQIYGVSAAVFRLNINEELSTAASAVPQHSGTYFKQSGKWVAKLSSAVVTSGDTVNSQAVLLANGTRVVLTNTWVVSA